jgi:hypothetical protein
MPSRSPTLSFGKAAQIRLPASDNVSSLFFSSTRSAIKAKFATLVDSFNQVINGKHNLRQYTPRLSVMSQSVHDEDLIYMISEIRLSFLVSEATINLALPAKAAEFEKAKLEGGLKKEEQAAAGGGKPPIKKEEPKGQPPKP